VSRVQHDLQHTCTQCHRKKQACLIFAITLPYVEIFLLETRIIGLHFAANGIDLSLFKFFWWAPKDYFISARANVSAVDCLGAV